MSDLCLLPKKPHLLHAGPRAGCWGRRDTGLSLAGLLELTVSKGGGQVHQNVEQSRVGREGWGWAGLGACGFSPPPLCLRKASPRAFFFFFKTVLANGQGVDSTNQVRKAPHLSKRVQP